MAICLRSADEKRPRKKDRGKNKGNNQSKSRKDTHRGHHPSNSIIQPTHSRHHHHSSMTRLYPRLLITNLTSTDRTRWIRNTTPQSLILLLKPACPAKTGRFFTDAACAPRNLTIIGICQILLIPHWDRPCKKNYDFLSESGLNRPDGMLQGGGRVRGTETAFRHI